jgi:hypothetical protein
MLSYLKTMSWRGYTVGSGLGGVSNSFWDHDKIA